MSEVKFACPHCGQHIACDDAYCNNRITCPACGRTLFVPRLAAFAPTLPGKLKLSMPVGAVTAIQPHAPELEPWTEEAWDKHAAGLTGERPEFQPLIWLFIVAPAVLAVLLVARGVRFTEVVWLFVLCAVLAGLAWARSRNLSGRRLVLSGLAGGVLVLAAYAAVIFGLVAGCALLGSL